MADYIPPFVIAVLAILVLLACLWGAYWWCVAHGLLPKPEDES